MDNQQVNQVQEPQQQSVAQPAPIAQQPVQQPIQTMQPQTTTPQQMSAGKPPVAAQILYALGICGLIIGLLACISIFMASSQSNLAVSAKLFGVKFTELKLLAIINAALVVGAFTLINFIRSGKLWALTTYTVLVSLNILTSLSDISARRVLIYQILVVSLLGTLWFKNRSYFH